mgnify:FL=1
MFTNHKEVSTSVVSTFNTKKKMKFNGSFTLGDFESGDLEIEYLEGVDYLDHDYPDYDEKTINLCEEIVQEINAIQFFINDEVNLTFDLECENHELKFGFRYYVPGMAGEYYEFTVSFKEDGTTEVLELPLESHWGNPESDETHICKY